MGFTSLFIGATGLTAHSDGMQVISNNLANVSTNGYKQADTLFHSLISQQMATGSTPAGNNATHVSQKGMGVTIGAIKTSFRQGGQELTNTATEMALEGNGFFGVSDPNSSNLYYTRDGSFRFDDQGYLLNTSGYRVQGGAIDRATGTVGSMSDMQLDLQEYVNGAGQTFTAVQSEPKATTSLTLSANLDFSATDAVTSSSNPFFAMFESWNALAEEPVGASSFSSGMKVYDENGENHALTIHFDEVGTSNLSNAVPGASYWEYTLTMNPDEDGRALFQGTSSAGLLSMGTMTFTNGQFTDMAAYSFAADGTDPSSLSNWDAAAFDVDGKPTFEVAFTSSGASTASQTIGYDMGLISSGGGAWSAGGASNAGGIGTNVATLGGMDNQSTTAFRTTNYDKGSNTNFVTQDGYARGFLRDLEVDRDGTVMGHFTNGQSEGLFKVGVYRFNSDYGLHREGGNLFLATSESGSAIEGFAQEGGRGAINGSSLELSNVDMATQFVKLITTQRGFQANTKVITTSDSILNTAISIKR